MDPFWQDIIKTVVDKGLLLVVGVILSLVIAKRLEKYKRSQAILTELGKARVASFVEVLRAMQRFEVLMAAYKEEIKKNPTRALTPDEQATLSKFMNELRSSYSTHFPMIGPHAGQLMVAYHEYAIELGQLFAQQKWDEMQKCIDTRGREFRQKLDLILPPLVDEDFESRAAALAKPNKKT